MAPKVVNRLYLFGYTPVSFWIHFCGLFRVYRFASGLKTDEIQG